MANINKKDRTSVKWVVVKFIDAKDFSVVPTNWLVENETENLSRCSVKYCKWPQKRVITSDDLQLAEDPHDSWALYKIKVLGGNKTYGKFAKAWHKQVLESTDDEEIYNKKQKRRISTSSDESCTEDIGYSIAPAIASSIQSSEPFDELQEMSYINILPSSSSTCLNADKNLNIAMINENFLQASKMNTTSIPDLQVLRNEDQNQSFSSSRKFPTCDKSYSLSPNLNFEQNQNLSILKTVGDLNHLTLPSTSEERLHCILKNIQTELVTNRLMNERILSQINSLKNDVAKLVPTGLVFSNDLEDKQFLEQFPFSDWENLLVCEKVLQTNNDVKEKFKHMLSLIGGEDAKSCIRRILKRLFTNKFAIDCSWTGRAFEKDLKKYKIQDLQIIEVLRSVIKNQFSQCSDAKFELDVQSWFRTAKTRYDRENK